MEESRYERKIAVVRIVWDGATREYHCKAYDQKNIRWPEADYYTEDRDDARATMKAMLKGRRPGHDE
jgi:hypothetical protein